MKFKDYMYEGNGSFRKAYFISPLGKIIDVDTNHIKYIINNPKEFDFTKDEIEKLYKKNNEMMGIEGKSREEIIRKIMKGGWIHIRKHKNFWSVNFYRLNKKIKEYLQRWADKLQSGLYGYKEKDQYIPIKLHGINYRGEFTIKDISKDVLYRLQESNGSNDNEI